MKTLVITNLFPNRLNPEQAMFNKQQIVALSKICSVKVVAPVPFLKYLGKHLPSQETIDEIEVYHPSYFLIPKVLRFTYGFFYYLGIKSLIKQIQKTFDFDCVFATWAYPDAYAAAKIAQELNKPLVVKVHGSDINILAQNPSRRAMIRWALQKASRVIAVSQPLKDKINKMNIAEENIVLIQNGVDTKIFFEQNKNRCREYLKLPALQRFVIYVGNLEHIKGVDVLLQAMSYLPQDQHLYYIGEGSLKSSLIENAKASGWQERVHFLGRLAHADLPRWMSAADCLCLPSRQEGCPNVILEAMACNVAVVASRVGGVPDLVEDNINGFLVEPQNPKALAAAIQKVSQENFSPKKSFRAISWTENARAVNHILNEACMNFVSLRAKRSNLCVSERLLRRKKRSSQ